MFHGPFFSGCFFLFLAWCFGGRNSYVLLLDLNGVLGPSTASPKLHPYSAAHVKRVIRLPNHFPYEGFQKTLQPGRHVQRAACRLDSPAGQLEITAKRKESLRHEALQKGEVRSHSSTLQSTPFTTVGRLEKYLLVQ